MLYFEIAFVLTIMKLYECKIRYKEYQNQLPFYQPEIFYVFIYDDQGIYWICHLRPKKINAHSIQNTLLAIIRQNPRKQYYIFLSLYMMHYLHLFKARLCS